MKKRMVAVLFSVALVCLAFTGITAFAQQTTSQEEVVATLSVNQESYALDEEIGITLTLENATKGDLEGVSTEIILPIGVSVLSGDALQEGLGLPAGESITNTITATKASTVTQASTGATSTQSDASTQASGEAETPLAQSGMPLYLWAILIALLAALGIVLFFVIKKRKGKDATVVSAFLVFALLFAALPALPASATAIESEPETFTVSQSISIDGTDHLIMATISYYPAGSAPGGSANSGTTADDTTDADSSTGSSGSGSSSSSGSTSDTQDFVTVSFDTGNGEAVEDIRLTPGSALGYYPAAYQEGYTFDLWYTDAALTQKFDYTTALYNDITLYADFIENEDDLIVYDETQLYLEDQSTNFSFTLYSKTPITSSNLAQYVTITTTSAAGEIASYSVSTNGDYYTITANGGYKAGMLYIATLSTDVTLTAPNVSGYNLAAITTLSFRIYKEEVVEYELADDIITIDVADLILLNEDEYAAVIEKSMLNGAVLTIDDESTVSTQYVDADEATVIYFEDTESPENSFYVKVTGVTEETVDGVVYCYFTFVDAELADIYGYIDIYFEDMLTENTITMDEDAIAQAIKEGDGVKQLTYLLAAALMESDVVNEMGDGTDVIEYTTSAAELASIQTIGTSTLDTASAATSFETIPSVVTDLRTMYTSSYTLSGSMFSSNAEIDDSSLWTIDIENLLEGLTVSVTLGEAENTNFDVADVANQNFATNWQGVNVTLTYEAELGNHVKLNATVDITEYINVTLGGWSEKYWNYSAFMYEVDFDYVTNIYTQTDLKFTILVCSANNDDAEDGAENNDNTSSGSGSGGSSSDDAGGSNVEVSWGTEWTDITDEIDGIISGEEESDSDTLVAQMLAMLEEDGDYIELLDESIFECSANVYICDVNFYLNFVVKFEFAAGLGAEFSYLSAEQYGIYTHEVNGVKYVSGYSNKLTGNGRYVFELSACGYLGVKVGISGEVSLSLPALKTFGEIGFGVEVGAYMDLYAYARYVIAKTESDAAVSQSLDGAVYFEVGIYLEMYLFARSELFNAEAEWVFLDYKWPIFSAGNQYVYLGLSDSNEALVDDYVIVLTGDYTSIEDAFPTFYGDYLDITTGEITSQALSSSLFMQENISTPYMRYGIYYTSADNYEWGFVYKNYSAYESCYADYALTYGNYEIVNEDDLYFTGTMEIHATGLSATNFLQDRDSLVGEFEFIWVSEDYQGDIEALGEVCTATFVIENEDGEDVVLATREVLSGKVVGALDAYAVADDETRSEYALFYDVSYELGHIVKTNYYTWYTDPTSYIIMEDTTFTISAPKRQAYVGYLYYDEVTASWISEYMVVENGDVPTLDCSSGEYTTFTGLSLYTSDTSVSQVVTDINDLPTIYTAPDAVYYTYLFDATSYSSSYNNPIGAIYDMCKNTTYAGAVDYFYVANYEFDHYEVTYVVKDDVITESVEYNSLPTQLYGYDTSDQYNLFIGWASTQERADADIVDYLPTYGIVNTYYLGTQISNVYDWYLEGYDYNNQDVTFYAVYETNTYKVTLVDGEGETHEWEMDWGDPVSDEVYTFMKAELAEYASVEEPDGVYYSNALWRKYVEGYTGNFGDSTTDEEIDTTLSNTERTCYWGDVTYYLFVNTYYEMTVTPGEGSFDEAVVESTLANMLLSDYYHAASYNEDGTITLYIIDAWYMEPNYFITALVYPEGSGDDILAYTYKFSHWEDQEGNIYLFDGNFPASQAEMTFTPIYEKVDIEYSVDIYTVLGLIADSSKTINFTGTYAEYQALIATYTADDYIPEGIEDVDYTYTYDRVEVTADDESGIITLIKVYWTQTRRTYTVSYTDTVGEGAEDASLYYGYNTTAPSLADVVGTDYTSSFQGWDVDADGVADYQGGDTITVYTDMALTALWQNSCTISFKDAVGTVGQSFTGVVGDAFDATQVSDPAAPDNRVFAGWDVDGDGEVDEVLPTTFTTNITISPVYVFMDCTVTLELTIDGVTSTYKTITAQYNDELADYLDTPVDATDKVWSGWGISGIGASDFAAYTITADTTVTGTITTVYVVYTLDGVQQSKDAVAPGAVVTVAEKEIGYSDWTVTGATVTDGTFTMPSTDVTIAAYADLTGAMSISDGTNTDLFDATTHAARDENGAVSGYTFVDGVLHITADGLTLSGEVADLLIVVADSVTALTLSDFTAQNITEKTLAETSDAYDVVSNLWSGDGEAAIESFNDYLIYALSTSFTLNIEGAVSLTQQVVRESTDDQYAIFYNPLVWGSYTEYDYEGNASEVEGYIQTEGVFTIQGIGETPSLTCDAFTTDIQAFAPTTVNGLAIDLTASTYGIQVQNIWSENSLENASLTLVNCEISAYVYNVSYPDVATWALSAAQDITITDCTLAITKGTVYSESGSVAFYGATGGTVQEIYCCTTLAFALDPDCVLNAGLITCRSFSMIALTDTVSSITQGAYATDDVWGYVLDSEGNKITAITFTGQAASGN